MAELEQPEEIIQLFQRATNFARELLDDNARLRRQLGKMEVETQQFAERYAAIAEQSDLLQNLFVVTHRLHATLNADEVLATMCEILLNLLGCERFSIFFADEVRG